MIIRKASSKESIISPKTKSKVLTPYFLSLGFKSPHALATYTVPAQLTGLTTMDLLQRVGFKASTYPSDFTVHNNLAKILKSREKSISEGQGVDWSTAEAMGFGSLLAEGHHVRLSGQDVERGTFSQRHAVLHNQVNVRTKFKKALTLLGFGRWEN